MMQSHDKRIDADIMPRGDSKHFCDFASRDPFAQRGASMLKPLPEELAYTHFQGHLHRSTSQLVLITSLLDLFYMQRSGA